MRENRVERRPEAMRSSSEERELRWGNDFCCGLSRGVGLEGSVVSGDGRAAFMVVMSNGLSEPLEEVGGGSRRARVSDAL